MKLLLFTVCLLIFSTSIKAQSRQFVNGKVVTTSDTSIIHKGDEDCTHKWVKQSDYINIELGLRASCMVYHGPAGCPNEWPVDFLICKNCLRHIKVSEQREWVSVENEYNKLVDKIPIKKGN